jgi:hypothetical protein
VADEESSPLGSRIPGEEIEQALKSLSLREQRVIELRYGLKGEGPWTCEEIGRHFGIHAVKIKQVENQVLRKLREASVSEEDLVAHWNRVFPEGEGSALVLRQRAVALALALRQRRPSAPQTRTLRPVPPTGILADVDLQQLRRLDADAEAAIRRISIVKLAATILVVYAVTLAAMLVLGLVTS